MKVHCSISEKNRNWFCLLLLDDVLVEIFNLTTRYQLAKFQLMCRKFHQIIEVFFIDRPLLVYRIRCEINWPRNRVRQIIGTEKGEKDRRAREVLYNFLSFLLS